jgi:hypothetical protein
VITALVIAAMIPVTPVIFLLPRANAAMDRALEGRNEHDDFARAGCCGHGRFRSDESCGALDCAEGRTRGADYAIGDSISSRAVVDIICPLSVRASAVTPVTS